MIEYMYIFSIVFFQLNYLVGFTCILPPGSSPRPMPIFDKHHEIVFWHGLKACSPHGAVWCQFWLMCFFPSDFLLLDLCGSCVCGGIRTPNLCPESDSLFCLENLLHLQEVTTVILYVLVLPSWHCSLMRWVRVLSLTQRQSGLLPVAVLRRVQNFLDWWVPPIQLWSIWAGRHSPAHTSSLMGWMLVQWPSEMYLVDLSSRQPIWLRSGGTNPKLRSINRQFTMMSHVPTDGEIPMSSAMLLLVNKSFCVIWPRQRG